jgi:hypothetical protein
MTEERERERFGVFEATVRERLVRVAEYEKDNNGEIEKERKEGRKKERKEERTRNAQGAR